MSDERTTAGVDRRRFLKVLGAAGGGAAVLSGCSTGQVEKLVPYLVQSEDQVPGVPTYYASSCTECGGGCGLHVKTREGRAIKLEGNPDHPVNQGKLCSRGQAALQGLYNPGRVKAPMVRSGSGFKEISWDDAIAQLAAKLQAAQGRVAVLSGAGRGTFSTLLADWTAALGGTVVRYQPLDDEPLRTANRQVFGRDEIPAHDFASAKYIVSFGADFLGAWLSPLEHARGFAQSHGYTTPDMAKFVCFAPRMNLTGLNADQWRAIKPGTETVLALALANVVARQRGTGSELGSVLGRYTPEAAAKETGVPAATIEQVGREFAAAQPSLAVAGGTDGRTRGAVQLAAAVNLLNYVAGNIGKTVNFGADLDSGDGYAAVRDLIGRMNGGQVQVLLVHESNPLYTLPAAAGFGAALGKVPFKVSTAMMFDETAAQCDLILPSAHALERWDDTQPRAGVRGLMQPVMEPVFPVRATGDVLLQTAKKMGGPLAKFTAPDFKTYLMDAWRPLAGGGDFGTFWRDALQRGGLFAPAPAAAGVALASGAASAVGYTAPTFDGDGEFIFLAYPHPMLHDGRGTNKPWLLENADPVTKLTWWSWIEVHPDTAQRINVRDGEILKVTSPRGTIEVPVFVYQGVHPGVLAMPLGFGHTEYGDFAKGRGTNALDLVAVAPSDDFIAYGSVRVSVANTQGYRQLATVAGVPRQLGRGIAQAMPLTAARKGLTVEEYYHEASEHGEGQHEEVNTPTEVKALLGWREEQLEEIRPYGDYSVPHPQWGMAIDLAKCTGCSACVTACYAENNIPTVGEDQILRGREMTWMRIERYWEGGEDGEPLEARFVPMLCQHCANAPCEPVCPVYAAYHTPDGLNGQVYNRCVGTRYCANNCPYKVRYFNWYKYNLMAWPEPLNWQLNPDVTVRARGVMEKCTMCIQRIRYAQNQAKVERRDLRDGEFTTACAQACPSYAIVFGNVKDPASRVRKVKLNHRGYFILEDLNTRPAVTYLAKVQHRTEA